MPPLFTLRRYKHLDQEGSHQKKELQKEAHTVVAGLVEKLPEKPEGSEVLATLHEADELSTAMAANDVLCGFEELPGCVSSSLVLVLVLVLLLVWVGIGVYFSISLVVCLFGVP